MGNRASSAAEDVKRYPNLTETQIQEHKKLFGNQKSVNQDQFIEIVEIKNFQLINQQYGKVSNAADVPGYLLQGLNEGWLKKFTGNPQDRLFSAMDTSANGTIELDEFLYFVNLVYGAHRLSDNKALFEAFYRLANLSHSNSLSSKEAKDLNYALNGAVSVKEGETMDDFIERTSQPETVKAVRQKAEIYTTPDTIVIQTIVGNYKFIPTSSGKPKTTSDLDELWEHSGAKNMKYEWYHQGKQIQGDLPANFPYGKLDDPVYVIMRT